MQHEIPFEGLAIGSQRTPSADGKEAPVYDPATGVVIARVAQAGPEDVDRAVRLAHQRFTEGSWKTMNTRQRHPPDRAGPGGYRPGGWPAGGRAQRAARLR